MPILHIKKISSNSSDKHNEVFLYQLFLLSSNHIYFSFAINHHTHSSSCLTLCSQSFSYPNYSLPPTTDTTNPGSRTILIRSTSKENISLLMTYAAAKPFFQPSCFPLRFSPNLASINTPHPMMTQYDNKHQHIILWIQLTCLSSTSTTITQNRSDKHNIVFLYQLFILSSNHSPINHHTNSSSCLTSM